jgi:hypothetical protein
MRTLVDLLNNDSGYVRIYADQAGFGYDRSTYTPEPIDDLFDRMSGYPSISNAREAAALQLQVKRATSKRRKTKKAR